MCLGRPLLAAAALAALVLSVFAMAASAQVPEIRLARQFSMGYLQFNLMEHHQLIEKHAKAAGIPEVKVVWATFNSPVAMNDALRHTQCRQGCGGVLVPADPARHPQS
jgi:NitT/TauT family transport system substrate-binding protein